MTAYSETRILQENNQHMKRPFFVLVKQFFTAIYKRYHKIKSGDNGIAYTKLILGTEKDEHGQPIFVAGETGINYRTEPHIKRAKAKLERFHEFLDNIQKLPPRNHPWWFEKFSTK